MSTEKTLIIVKHDGVSRSLIGEVVRRFENIGLKIVAMKMVWADERVAGEHYLVSDEWAKGVFSKAKVAAESKGLEFPYDDYKSYADNIQLMNREYLMEGPVVAMVFEGPHVVEISRKIVGSTEPRQAPPGTIRGDYMFDSYVVADGNKRSIRNLIHASGTVDEATREIALWFKPEELHSYQKSLDSYHS